MENISIQSEKELLISYACEQFEKAAYDKALEAFILAYQKGYEKEWIFENIYNCYMIGNEEEFRKTYMHQAADAKISYDECLLDFIPYRDGENGHCPRRGWSGAGSRGLWRWPGRAPEAGETPWPVAPHKFQLR